MKRVWIGALAGLVFISWQDAGLWGGIFERDQLWQYIGVYHAYWFRFLWALMALGFVWLWPRLDLAVLHAAMLYTLFFGGLPDVLYYWLQGRAIPDALPWLDAHPLILFSPVTRGNLIASTCLWVAFWGAVSALWVYLPRHPRIARWRMRARLWPLRIVDPRTFPGP